MSRGGASGASADLAFHQDQLTDTYAFNKVNQTRKQPGPATVSTRTTTTSEEGYSPSKNYSLARGPRATIGKEERFSSTFAGMFIRAEAASELQCRDSPGPIYSPTHSNLPRAQTVSWGQKPDADSNITHSRNILDRPTNQVSPAAYFPRADRVLPRAPRASFGSSDRFMSFGSSYSLNNSPWTSDGPTGLADMASVRPRSAAYSFGGGMAGPPRANDHSARSRPRTAFLTHSIRGGLARPATLECGIGPSDYSTDQSSIARNVKAPVGHKNGFGSASRFTRPGLVFVSAEHARSDGSITSPGPKYASAIGSIQCKPRAASTSLHWSP